MNPRRTVVIVALVVVGIAIGVVVWKNHSRAGFEMKRAALAEKCAASTLELHRLQERLPTGEKSPLTSRVRAERSREAEKPAAAKPPLQGDPASEARWLAARNSALRAGYRVFFRTLGLRADQIATFLKIANRREEQNLDIRKTMQSQKLAYTDPALVALRDRAEAEYQSSIENLLGGSGAKQLEGFEQTMMVRDLVTALAGRTTLEGAPLSARQCNELVQAFANASSSYLQGKPASPDTIDWEILGDRARAILSETQYGVFKTFETGAYGPAMSRLTTAIVQAAADDRAKSATSAP
jgi:hypothetical protein